MPTKNSKPKKELNRICGMCGKEFKTVWTRQHICSFNCRKEANRERAKELQREKRSGGRLAIPCQVCGFDETIDKHHEGRKIYYLCPNHHALITRNIKKISDYNIRRKGLDYSPIGDLKHEQHKGTGRSRGYIVNKIKEG